MVDLWRKHESVEATVYTEFVTVIETFVLVFQMTSHVDHQQRLLQGELFVVVLDVVAVVVTIPKICWTFLFSSSIAPIRFLERATSVQSFTRKTSLCFTHVSGNYFDMENLGQKVWSKMT